MIKEGTLVTWGNGKPRARVLYFTVGEDIDTSEVCQCVRVALVEDIVASCGSVFLAGDESDIPLRVLREVPVS